MEDIPRQRAAIEALDAVAPQVVRVANAARLVDLHLLIADAINALEHGEVELALRVLRGARADRMPTRGRRTSVDDRWVVALGTPAP